MSDPSKTEKPTPKKKGEFRKKGSVAKSVEVSTALVLLITLLIFRIFGKHIFNQLEYVIRFYFTNVHSISVQRDELSNIFLNILFNFLIIVVPIMIVILLVIIISNILQIGFLLTLTPIKPNPGKLNPIKGFQNLVSKKSLENLFKTLAKMIFIGYIVYSSIRKDVPIIFTFFDLSLLQSFFIICKMAGEILYKIMLAFIIIAGADYAFQRYSLNEQMKMTKQEIKEEHKRSEGDPQIKGAIRRRQQEMARHRMMEEVPQADVVITNPFHVAVAVRYNAQDNRAPIVTAKGIRKVAERIRDLATENNVPIVENPPVARSLYKNSKVGEPIPSDMYSAVADILTYIYKISGKTFGI